jgi:pimeloyl-ACP methyl ester carboxylesterase
MSLEEIPMPRLRDALRVLPCLLLIGAAASAQPATGFAEAPPKGPYSDVDDLHAVLETLKIGRSVLAGCSNGSRLAVDYTLAHPDRVEALVLVGPLVSGLPYSETSPSRRARRKVADQRIPIG